MKAALVGADGELLHRARRATGRDRGPEAVVAGILDFAAELRAYGADRFGGSAVAAGVAVPGIVDEERGTAVYAANLGWRDVPLRALLGSRLGGVPVALGHDVRAGGLAEGRIGAGRAPTGSCSYRWAPASRAPSASTAGWRPAPTASRARSATSSSGPAALPARAGSAAAWNGSPRRPRSARPGPRPAGTRTRTPPTAPRPSSPATPGPSGCGRTRWTPSPTGWSPRSPCWTRAP